MPDGASGALANAPPGVLQQTPLPPLRRVLLIVNPASRRGAGLMPAAVDELRRHNVAVTTMSTRGPGDAGHLARTHASGYDAVFALGGDGTTIEVVGALSPGDIPVGILPGGTGNLMARALRIPLNARRAVRRLLGGAVSRIDLGRLSDGRWIAVGVGCGIDARMIDRASPQLKRRLGILAYIVTGTAAVIRRTPFDVRVTVDGVSYTHQAAELLVSNVGTVLGGLVTLGPDIHATDGILNICLFNPTSFRDSLRIMRKLIFRNFRPDPAMVYYRGTSITVEANPPQVAQADGEMIGGTPFSVVAEPSAGCIIVPSGVRLSPSRT